MGGDDFDYDNEYDKGVEMPVDTSFGDFATNATAGKNSMGGEDFDVGAVNDIQAEKATEGGKWHPHTLKVLNMLRNNMGGAEGGSLSFKSLSDGCSRRTAAGVFFELLQLKTWDFINVDQNDAYGDILISPGVKFEEDVSAREGVAA